LAALIPDSLMQWPAERIARLEITVPVQNCS
jgi:hypothetical protein